MGCGILKMLGIRVKMQNQNASYKRSHLGEYAEERPLLNAKCKR